MHASAPTVTSQMRDKVELSRVLFIPVCVTCFHLSLLVNTVFYTSQLLVLAVASSVRVDLCYVLLTWIHFVCQALLHVRTLSSQCCVFVCYAIVCKCCEVCACVLHVHVCSDVCMCNVIHTYNTPLPPIGMEITAPIHQVPHSYRRPLCCHVHCLQRHRPRCSDWLHHPQWPCPCPVTIPLSRTSECDTQPHLLSYWECPKL